MNVYEIITISTAPKLDHIKKELPQRKTPPAMCSKVGETKKFLGHIISQTQDVSDLSSEFI